MQADLDKLGGLVHSQQVMLALTQKGVSREDAYVFVQRNAMKIWAEGGSYLDKLKGDSDVTRKAATSTNLTRFSISTSIFTMSTQFLSVFWLAHSNLTVFRAYHRV